MTAVSERRPERVASRVPPHSVESEESVLGSILMSVDALNEVMDKLEPEDFYVPAHQSIFGAIRTLFDGNRAIDAITVSEELRRVGELERVGGVAYVTRLLDIVPSASNVDYYANIVLEHSQRRHLIRAGSTITDLAFRLDDEITEVLDRSEQTVLGVAGRTVGEGIQPIGPLFFSTLEELEALEAAGSDVTGLSTGFRDLDRKLTGLHPANLMIIAARPAMGKCLVGDTRVLDPKTGGLITVRELAESPELVSLAHVASLDRTSARFEGAVPAAATSNGVKPVVEIRTRLGRRLRATRNHPLLTLGGWRTLGELELGDTVAVPAKLEMFGVDRLPDAEVALLAYMLGDGTTTGTVPRFSNTDPAIVRDVEGWAAQFGLQLTRSGSSSCYRITTAGPGLAACAEAAGVSTSTVGLALGDGGRLAAETVDRVRQVARAIGVRRSGNVLRDLLEHHGLWGRTADSKRIPDAVFRLPEDQLALFLSRLYATNGSAWVSSSSYRVEYVTVSEQMAYDLQHLLLRFGVVAKVRERSVRYGSGRRRAFEVAVQDPSSVVAFCERIGIYGKEQALGEVERVARDRADHHAGWERMPIEIWDVIDDERGDLTWAEISRRAGRPSNHNWHVRRRRITRSTLRELADAIDSDRLRSLATSQVVWDDIVSIEAAGLEETFDLDVPGHRNFVADDVVVHNSALTANIATNVAMERRPVAFFSLEMSKEEVAQRMLCSVARIDSMKLRTGQIGEAAWPRLTDAAGKLYDAPIYVDDSPVVTVTDIRAKCRRLKRQHGLALVVVDYMQLMQGSNRENRQQEIAEISRALKNLARELDVPIIAVSQLNRNLEAREDKRPRLGDLRESGCLTADTVLVRADTNQRVTLGELVADNATDVPVWSLDERYRLVPAHISRAFSSGVKETFELRFASGARITASANHPFLTVDGWRRVDQLEVGDFLATARSIPPAEQPQTMGDAEIVLLAHLIGDGCHLERHVLQYTTTDERNASTVRAAAMEAFGIEGRVHEERDWIQVYLTSARRLARGTRNPICEWLDGMGLFGRRSWEKFVPEPVFSLPRHQIALFLSHLWATDGTLHRRSSGDVVISYTTASERLARDVVELLLRIGIPSRLSQVEERRGRTRWDVRVTGRDPQLAFLDLVGCAGRRGEVIPQLRRQLEARVANPNVDVIPAEIWDYVRTKALDRAQVTTRELARRLGMSYAGSALYRSGLSRARMARLAEALDDPLLSDLATSDVLWDRVVAIEPKGPQPVFDVTVPGTHNFLANSIVAHNSLEQDADVVVFIYRDEYYNEGTEKRGIAEVVIAKHRAGSTGTVEMTFMPEFTKFSDLGRD